MGWGPAPHPFFVHNYVRSAQLDSYIGMTIKLHSPYIGEGDQYLAGYSEDGEPIIVFDRFIVAEDAEGNGYAHFKIFKGFIINHEGYIYPNYNQKNEATDLLQKISSKIQGADQTFDADPAFWTKLPPRISLEESLNNEYFREMEEGMARI